MYFLLLIYGCAWGIAGAATTPPFRLPPTVIPQAYRIDLTIDPASDRFSGHVEIDVQLVEPATEIWIHGQDLDVEVVTVGPVGGAPFPVEYAQLSRDGMSRLSLGRLLEPAQLTLRFDYSASFGQGLSGLYVVRVDDHNYVFSQLESVHARKVIPSFDEPVFKTPFVVTVTTPANNLVFSNAQQIHSKVVQANWQTVSFAPTTALPTYLLAFAVGPFDVVEWEPVQRSPYRESPVPLRGITVSGQGARIQFALRQTAPLLLSLEEYFATAYPFSKLDIVAVPDFGAGAMENAALITYREPLILLDNESSVAQKSRHLKVHAHELAHQWFGNLVTMPWWDDIWLNEAFASWMQVKIAGAKAPEYHFDRSTQVRAIGAMRIDSLVSTRRIREPVESTSAIFAAFDGITYRKGAGVLQMIESYLGADVFRDGLRLYMDRFAGGSATVYDLVDALQDAAAANNSETGSVSALEDIFESFLFSPGVPYLQVASRCHGDTLQISVEQSRYFRLGSQGNSEQIWTMPFCIAWGGNNARQERCVLLNEKKSTHTFPTQGSCPAWVMPNANGAGYLRWWVDEPAMTALSRVFLTQLNTAERISFADSYVAGVRAGERSMDEFFAQLPTLMLAPEAHVLLGPLTVFREYFGHGLTPEQRQSVSRYAMDTFGSLLMQVNAGGTSMDDADEAVLRYQLTRLLAVDVQDPDLISTLIDSAHRYLGYPAGRRVEIAALDPDLLRPALIVAARAGDAAFVEFLMDAYLKSSDANFRLAAIEALAFVNDPGIVKEVRKFALSDSVRGNELARWLSWILNPGSRSLNWPWVRRDLGNILAAGNIRIGRNAPHSFGRWLCGNEDADTLASLFTPYLSRFPGSDVKLAQATEEIRLCAALRKSHADSQATAFLSSH